MIINKVALQVIQLPNNNKYFINFHAYVDGMFNEHSLFKKEQHILIKYLNNGILLV